MQNVSEIDPRPEVVDLGNPNEKKHFTPKIKIRVRQESLDLTSKW